MVKCSEETLSLIFRAMADPTRRAILARLAQGECTVSELAAPFDMSLAAVSKHLKILESARILIKTRDGRNFRCRMNPEPLRAVDGLIRRYEGFWQNRLESLETYFDELSRKEESDHDNSIHNRNHPEGDRKKTDKGKQGKPV